MFIVTQLLVDFLFLYVFLMIIHFKYVNIFQNFQDM